MIGPRIVLAGSVDSSRWTLEELTNHGAQVVGVLGLAPNKSSRVSDYVHLRASAVAAGAGYLDFEKINNGTVIAQVEAWKPDVLFVVGLSQLVGKKLLALPTRAVVGFHPTKLPQGRGRAPLVWLILSGKRGAATFFEIDEGVDSGPILVQEPFEVGPDDYASDVMSSLETATRRALARWIPALISGEWSPRPQDHSRATWTGARLPADGLIHWSKPATEVFTLIRAASRPYPGAYTHVDDHRLRVWRASLADRPAVSGALGRVLEIGTDGNLLVQTGDGSIWLTEIEWDEDWGGPHPQIRVGTRMGYVVENEIFRLQQRLATLESRLEALDEGTR